MKKATKKIILALTALMFFVTSCNQSIALSSKSIDSNTSGERSVYSGTHGSLEVTGMNNSSLTVSYTSEKLNYARLFVSAGNSAGLVLANQDMKYENGKYTYTLSHPTFEKDALIYVTVLINDGSEKCVPQGILSDTLSWTQIKYGVETETQKNEILYSIICKCSDKAVTIESDSAVEGGNVNQKSYSKNADSQKWILKQTDGEWYFIENAKSGLVLSVANESNNDGANVIQASNRNFDSQKWKLEDLNDGTVKIVNKKSSKVLDVAWASKDDGANIQQCNWNTGDAQRWYVTKLETEGTDPEVPAENPSENPGTVTYSKYLNNENLVALKNGLMTMQFKNMTKGAWNDDQIYITAVALDGNHRWCYLTPEGNLNPIGADSTSEGWSFTLAQLKSGIQMPAMSSGRLYVGMGSPVHLRGVVDAAGNVGIAQPDLNNPTDVNQDKYFDWIEFTLSKDGFWGNTTQVDQFSFPIVMAMYNTDGYFRSVGVTETREEIFSAFEKLGDNFNTLVQRPYRIIAPCKGQFRNGREFGNYMQSYVNYCWDYYLNGKHPMKIVHPLGTFTGYSTADGKFVFHCENSGYGSIAKIGKDYFVQGKPSNDELFEGSGVLASPTPGADGDQITVELALQAWVCAALNRHIFTEPQNWDNPSTWYKDGPCNYYASFWHNHNIDSAAYGFCYDDVFDQSSLIQTGNPRGLVIGIGW